MNVGCGNSFKELQVYLIATLNQRMGKDGNGKPYRVFAKDEGLAKNRATYDINNLYRYESLQAHLSRKLEEAHAETRRRNEEF